MSAGQGNNGRITSNVIREASVAEDTLPENLQLTEDWRPSATITVMKQRAALLTQIRIFMQAREILEVETPVLDSAANPDPAIDSLMSAVRFPDTADPRIFYLQTSPEFAMKRLLAAGSGPVYQICKVFRDNEYGRLHQPEFTMLEWYRPGFDHHDLMHEVGELLASLQCSYPEITTYADAFIRYTGLNPHRAGLSELIEYAVHLGLDSPNKDRSLLLDLIFSHQVAPHLGKAKPQFIYDYPACQAALAHIRKGPMDLAERFELFMNGIEIANGFNELCDIYEQYSRFSIDNVKRRQAGLAELPLDQRLLAALGHGLPPCAGVALGVDRLLLVLTRGRALTDVLCYPLSSGR